MTHEYVKMAMTAFPLQRQWPPGKCDWYIKNKFYKVLYSHIVEDNMSTVNGYTDPERTRNLGGWKGYKWVPRVSQLLYWWETRVRGGKYVITRVIKPIDKYTYDDEYWFSYGEDTNIKGDSLEEAIIKAIMAVEYNRTWQDGRWRKVMVA